MICVHAFVNAFLCFLKCNVVCVTANSLAGLEFVLDLLVPTSVGLLITAFGGRVRRIHAGDVDYLVTTPRERAAPSVRVRRHENNFELAVT